MTVVSSVIICNHSKVSNLCLFFKCVFVQKNSKQEKPIDYTDKWQILEFKLKAVLPCDSRSCWFCWTLAHITYIFPSKQPWTLFHCLSFPLFKSISCLFKHIITSLRSKMYYMNFCTHHTSLHITGYFIGWLKYN